MARYDGPTLPTVTYNSLPLIRTDEQWYQGEEVNYPQESTETKAARANSDDLANYVASNGRYGSASELAIEISQAIEEYKMLDGLYTFETIMAIRAEGGTRLDNMRIALTIQKTLRMMSRGSGGTLVFSKGIKSEE